MTYERACELIKENARFHATKILSIAKKPLSERRPAYIAHARDGEHLIYILYAHGFGAEADGSDDYYYEWDYAINKEQLAEMISEYLRVCKVCDE